MARLQQLQEELHRLRADMDRIRNAGECLQGIRLEFTPAGGTASNEAKQTCKYARLRAGKGKTLSNGKKSQYVPLSQIAHYQAAIARGQQLARLTRRMNRIQSEIAQITATAVALGFSVPPLDPRQD